MDISTIFLFVISVLLGIAVGSLLERNLRRRKTTLPHQASTSVISSTDKLASEGDVEILRAWRTLSGRTWLEMDGARLNGKESLKPDQRRRLISLLLDLRPWLENTPAAVASDVDSRPPAGEIPAVRKIKTGAEVPKPVPVFKTIVEQIDDILQTKLSESSLKDRVIHLIEGPGGIVFVLDGLEKYEGIDSVPESEIKSIIRQAVAEWEKLTR